MGVACADAAMGNSQGGAGPLLLPLLSSRHCSGPQRSPGFAAVGAENLVTQDVHRRPYYVG
jgi:hypothetical protein